jgi:hypothetical protein
MFSSGDASNHLSARLRLWSSDARTPPPRRKAWIVFTSSTSARSEKAAARVGVVQGVGFGELERSDAVSKSSTSGGSKMRLSRQGRPLWTGKSAFVVSKSYTSSGSGHRSGVPAGGGTGTFPLRPIARSRHSPRQPPADLLRPSHHLIVPQASCDRETSRAPACRWR